MEYAAGRPLTPGAFAPLPELKLSVVVGLSHSLEHTTHALLMFGGIGKIICIYVDNDFSPQAHATHSCANGNRSLGAPV
jgi:hypothetical protein